MRILPIVLLLSGCFAFSDTGRFEEDRGCDMQLRVRNFTPHTDDKFTVMLVSREADPDTSDPQEESVGLLAVAIFEPLESRDMNLRMPGSVAPLTNPTQQRPSIDFFGDDDSTPGYSFPGDHSWRRDDACADGPDVFLHDTNFDPLPIPELQRTDLTVSLCGVPDGAPIEVRVYADLPIEGGDDTRRALGLYRFTENTREDETLELVLPGIIDTGFEHFIDVYVDANADGTYDAGERAWAFRLAPDPGAFDCALLRLIGGVGNGPQAFCADVDLPERLPDMLGGALLPRFPACVDAPRMGPKTVRVTLGRLGDRTMLGGGATLRNLSGRDAEGNELPNSWVNFDPDDTGD